MSCIFLSISLTFLQWYPIRHVSHLTVSGAAGIESRTRRHAFLDNLVPLAAFEGILDCNKVRESAAQHQLRWYKGNIQVINSACLLASAGSRPTVLLSLCSSSLAFCFAEIKMLYAHLLAPVNNYTTVPYFTSGARSIFRHSCDKLFTSARTHASPLLLLLGAQHEQLPPSATTPLSRARRRWLLSQWHNRMSVSPSTAKVSTQHREDTPRHLRGGHSSPLSPSSSSRPTPTTLEVDDLFFVGVGQRTSLDSTGDIVGLEEQIKREECSEGRMARRRAMMEATKKAVCEALVLWSKKADLLQVGSEGLGQVRKGPGLLREALAILRKGGKRFMSCTFVALYIFYRPLSTAERHSNVLTASNRTG